MINEAVSLQATKEIMLKRQKYLKDLKETDPLDLCDKEELMHMVKIIKQTC